MTPRDEFLLILGMTAVTFGVRYFTLAALSRASLPEPLFRALRYVPPAVLAAIIAPAVLIDASGLNLSHTNAPLFASLVAIVVSWRTRNLLFTIVLGMLALWTWKAMFGV
ncbi:MAG: AzlD domain-containing protein [Anaerolineae bacterium]|nr:MAG: AzlD domain-containing protein [Anaerolineae bacterium]